MDKIVIGKPVDNNKIKKRVSFNTKSVLAIRKGLKIQTRRLLRIPKGWVFDGNDFDDDGTPLATHPKTGCLTRIPDYYGKVGDTMLLTETHRWADKLIDGYPRDSPYYVEYKADGYVYHMRMERPVFVNNWSDLWTSNDSHGKWRPSIHMPVWASRIRLKIEENRWERLNQIDRCGMINEGVSSGLFSEFIDYWDSINEKRGASFFSNPWVRVITFFPMEFRAMTYETITVKPMKDDIKTKIAKIMFMSGVMSSACFDILQAIKVMRTSIEDFAKAFDSIDLSMFEEEEVSDEG